MRDRLLPLWAAVLGLCVALAVFVPLHLVLEAGAARAIAILAIGAAVIGGLLWYVRRAEVLRTTQAQGYFTAVMMTVAIALVMLPPGYLTGTLLR